MFCTWQCTDARIGANASNTRNDNRNLTQDIPKEIADVEAFTQG